MTAPSPTDVTWHALSRMLALGWDDGTEGRLTAARLRAACKCAACEHQRRGGQPPEAPADTDLESINPIGSIGVQLVFNDGHDRGIYPWTYLHQLSQETCA